MTAPLISLEGVHKWFDANHVLRGIDLAIDQGQVVAVIGPSGSGKSTLLRCINMLEEPTAGRVLFDGTELTDVRVDLNEVRTHIGIVFQAFNLFPHRTALTNITLALRRVLRLDKAAAEERARTQLAAVGLADRADAYPSQLSGGQQQRVAIARALAMEPKVLLLDEITSALDLELVREVLEVVERLAAEGMTMLLVTHEIAFARQVAHRVVFMDEGVILEDGPPSEVIDRPRGARAQAFMSKIL